MKLSQLSLADYNKLDNIPVINQDLSATDFTPVANTYYHHTGATTATFTQGVIYLYGTTYHELGESGGGTTLNRYEVYNNGNAISADLVKAIATQSKYPELIKIYAVQDSKGMYGTWFNVVYVSASGIIYITGGEYAGSLSFSSGYIDNGSVYYLRSIKDTNNTISVVTDVKPATIRIVYYNDTEITI